MESTHSAPSYDENQSAAFDPMNIPSAYVSGYERARARDPDLATTYIEHTMIGDPTADAVVKQLASLPPRQVGRFIQAGMDQERGESFRNAPPALREFFDGLESPPDWLNLDAFEPGVRMFHRNTRAVLAGMVGGTLVEGFSTNISKSFFISGRLRDQGVRRLKQNNRHMLEIFVPQGLERFGDGWKLSVRIRLIHAQLRSLMANSDDWQLATWGTPISSAHLGFAITAFSARLLQHMQNLGASYNDEEAESFVQVWRYSGYLMGIPESILFRDTAEALKLFDIGRLCEPPLEFESTVMAHSLINSAPLLAGVTETNARRSLAKYLYGISRALIGNDLADRLNFPRSSTFGVLGWFRLQARTHRRMMKMFPKRIQNSNFANFTSMLDASMFDDEGITYRMPDHVYAEESSRW